MEGQDSNTGNLAIELMTLTAFYTPTLTSKDPMCRFDTVLEL